LTILQLSFRAVKENNSRDVLRHSPSEFQFDAVQHNCGVREGAQIEREKTLSCFAFRQTDFALGQVSDLRSG
jgi:hypothetical protein